MLTHFIELLLTSLFDLLARRPRRGTAMPANAIAQSATGVTIGKIVRSPLAPPPEPGEPGELVLTTEEMRRSLYILGSTGTGKTTLLLRIMESVISQRRGCVLLDFRGELVDRVLTKLAARYSPEEMDGRLLLIDLRRSDYSVPFNPLQEDAADEYARVRFLMDVIGQQWEIGVQTEQLLRNSLLALSVSGNSIYELEPFLTDRAFRARVLESVRDASVRRFFARFDSLQNPGSWVEPVLNKVSPWLSRPVLRNMLAQSGTVSFRKVIEARPDCVVLVSLAADTLYGDAHMMGCLIASAIMSAAMCPARRDRKGNEIVLFLDEFEHFDGLSEQMSAILSEGRKFGLSCVLSHQTSIQLNPKLRSLIRNVVGTQVFFGVGGGEAETLANEIPSDEPKAVLRTVLMSQKVGECAVVRRGQPWMRVRTRFEPDPEVPPATVEALAISALRRYGRRREDVDADIARSDAAFEASARGQCKALEPKGRRTAKGTMTGGGTLEVRDIDAD